jgi:hypothetical protein
MNNIRLPGSSATSVEPFERRYLDALSEEGIDLPVFLASWRRAMADDLARLSALCHEDDPDRLRGVLHRLSGAVGLVGACSLMDALRLASALLYMPKSVIPNSVAINALIERAENLVMQIGAQSVECRSRRS